MIGASPNINVWGTNVAQRLHLSRPRLRVIILMIDYDMVADNY